MIEKEKKKLLKWTRVVKTQLRNCLGTAQENKFQKNRKHVGLPGYIQTGTCIKTKSQKLKRGFENLNLKTSHRSNQETQWMNKWHEAPSNSNLPRVMYTCIVVGRHVNFSIAIHSWDHFLHTYGDLKWYQSFGLCQWIQSLPLVCFLLAVCSSSLKFFYFVSLFLQMFILHTQDWVAHVQEL